MSFAQPPLFDSEPTRPVPRMRAPAKAHRYTRYRAAARALCGDCTADIHARGQAGAPYPARALWRRTDADDGTAVLLCSRHKEERQDRETTHRR